MTCKFHPDNSLLLLTTAAGKLLWFLEMEVTDPHIKIFKLYCIKLNKRRTVTQQHASCIRMTCNYMWLHECPLNETPVTIWALVRSFFVAEVCEHMLLDVECWMYRSVVANSAEVPLFRRNSRVHADPNVRIRPPQFNWMLRIKINHHVLRITVDGSINAHQNRVWPALKS